MYQKNPPKKSKMRYFIFAGLSLITGLVTLFALEYTGVTDFYGARDLPVITTEISKPLITEDRDTTNVVDYGPAKNEDNTTIPDKNINSTSSPTTNPELSAIITSTRNNSTNSSYLIKVAVAGTDSGSCKATMTKGSKILTTSTDISLSAGQYSCTNLEIPLSSLDESGNWNVEVTVTDKTGATSSTNAEVIL